MDRAGAGNGAGSDVSWTEAGVGSGVVKHRRRGILTFSQRAAWRAYRVLCTPACTRPNLPVSICACAYISHLSAMSSLASWMHFWGRSPNRPGYRWPRALSLSTDMSVGMVTCDRVDAFDPGNASRDIYVATGAIHLPPSLPPSLPPRFLTNAH